MQWNFYRSKVVKREYQAKFNWLLASCNNQNRKKDALKELSHEPVCTYLLKETAQGYFTKKGYETIVRAEAPENYKKVHQNLACMSC